MYIPLTFQGALQKCLAASSSLQGTFVSGGIQYAFHKITGSGNFEVFNGSLQAQLLVVGGGGGGGTAGLRPSGGGGGAQVKYFPTQQFYAGTYNVSIAAGGAEAGGTGGTTTITGPGVSVASVGGSGGTGTTGGTSGDGFLGGTGCTNFGGNGGVGGGGGGSRGAAQNENCSSPQPADGGIGFDISIDNFDWSFGCGGGGGASNISWKGASCWGGDGFGSPTGSAGGPNTGNGGGGSWLNGFGTSRGGAGGTGIVVIQYPIEEYCTNYFNATGSCGCRQVTFDIDDQNYTPLRTGSFIYMPCGGSKFVSGSLSAYTPLTVCAASNSYFTFTPDVTVPLPNPSTASFATTGPECFSASLVSIPCSPEAFAATNQSIIVTNYTPSGSGGNTNTFRFVAKNATTHSIYTSTSARVNYLCISTGSLFNGLDRYPKVLTGTNNILFNTASCNNVTFTSNKSPGFNRQFKYYDCNGSYRVQTFNGPGSLTVCIDRSAPFGFTGGDGTSVTIGSECLGQYFDTGSC